MFWNNRFLIRRKRDVKKFLNEYFISGTEYTVSVGNTIYILRKDLKGKVYIIAKAGEIDDLFAPLIIVAGPDKKSIKDESVEDIVWNLRKSINRQYLKAN